MKILLVTATAFEIENLIDNFILDHNIDSRLVRYRYNGLTIDVLYTGIGMVQTAFWMGKVLNEDTYDLSVNVGIAGSYRKEIKIGDVVNVTSDLFSELGAEDGDKFLTWEELEFQDSNEYPFINGRLYNFSEIDNEALKQIPTVRGITCNTIHGNDKSIKKIQELYDPDIESMEGAAFLYSCACVNIPCVQIRSISNYVNIRNKEDWNIRLAMENLSETVKIVLNHF